ncbi:MAG TPA: WD40 repeat domain-containing protein, partial [Aggregatilineales bacterium]|nr:WD40 repeat domain-containing protein [Aggregatilineales bacterium]
AWEFYIAYLYEIGQFDEIITPLTNIEWMSKKIQNTDTESLIKDYDRLGNENLKPIRDALRLSGAVTMDKAKLWSELTQRLAYITNPDVQRLMTSYMEPHFLSLHPTLSPPQGYLMAHSQAHQNFILGLGVSPNRSAIATCSADKTVIVWDVETGKSQATLKGHEAWVLCAVWIDDTHLASGSADETIRIWNVSTGKIDSILTGHEGAICCLSVVDNTYIASGATDGTIRLWDVKQSKQTQIFTGHNGTIYGVAFMVNGRVVSVAEDGAIKVWNISSGECLQTILAHDTDIHAVAVLDERHIVTASADKTLKVWDITTSKCLRVLEGHTDAVMSVTALHPLQIASASADKTVRVWSLDTYTSTHCLKGHEDGVNSIAIIGSGMLASCGQDGRMSLWNIHSQNPHITSVEKHERIVKQVYILNDHQVLSSTPPNTIYWHGDTYLWDSISGQVVSRFDAGYRFIIPYQPDQLILENEMIYQSQLWRWQLNITDLPQQINWIHGSHIQQMCVVGQYLAILEEVWDDGINASLQIWDMVLRIHHRTYRIEKSQVSDIVALTDESFVSVGKDKGIRVWDIHNANPVQTFWLDFPLIHVISMPKRDCLIVCTDQNEILCWDFSKQSTRKLGHHQKDITGISVLDDGLIATTSKDGTACVWDIDKVQKLAQFNAPNALECLATRADGLTVLGDILGYVYFLKFINSSLLAKGAVL